MIHADIRGPLSRRIEICSAAYSDNLAPGLAAALAARFPVVRRLVGEMFFRAMAYDYAAKALSRASAMMFFGETFPDFINDFAPARPIPYLADIARIEMARGRARLAVDATPLKAGAVADIRPDRMGDLRVKLHPSLAVIVSAYPVHSIWRVNQDAARFAPVSPWAGEAALIVRPRRRVGTQRISGGQAVFINALAAGRNLGQAGEAARQLVPAFTMAEGIAFLVGARFVVGIGNDVHRQRSH
jgi:hypothetical protein